VRLAKTNHANAAYLADKLGAISGVTIVSDSFFNEFTVRLPKPAAPVVEDLAARGILAGVPAGRFWPKHSELANLLLVAVTETNTEADMEALASALGEVLR